MNLVNRLILIICMLYEGTLYIFVYNRISLLIIVKTKCPPSFHKIGSGCYFYGYFKLNWFRAMEFCHTFGTGVSLATIETREENESIENWLVDHGKEFNED